jgi:phage-related protein
MKLSKAQLQYIQSERAKMDQRYKDLKSFGDDIYKNAELSAELGRIHYNRWFFNMMLILHKVEVEAEKTQDGGMSKEDYETIYGWGGQG